VAGLVAQEALAHPRPRGARTGCAWTSLV